MNKKQETKQGPGRPSFQVKIPQGRFTFIKLCAYNGATDDKGNLLPKDKRRCVPLTLRNFLAADKELGNSSKVIVLEDEKAPRRSQKGATPKLYLSRVARENGLKAKSRLPKTKKQPKTDVTIPVNDVPSVTPSVVPVTQPVTQPAMAMSV